MKAVQRAVPWVAWSESVKVVRMVVSTDVHLVALMVGKWVASMADGWVVLMAVMWAGWTVLALAVSMAAPKADQMVDL